MQLDKLQLDLRPRSNSQALDLGFSLLRTHAGVTYLVWLALWVPLVAACGLLACLTPTYAFAWLLLAWWLRPLLERAPLYVLSRQVFGETVGWRDALRAWPKQLGGGWFSMLTWRRLFAAGRSSYQPIWQLEGARGKVAADRRSIIGRNGTARSALWFSVACANFEAILQLGMLAFIGIFVSDEQLINPFGYLLQNGNGHDSVRYLALCFAGYALSGGIVGPIYTACGFTLYLNRRATLEAWDIELALRQIKPPVRKARGTQHSAVLCALLTLALLTPALLRPMPAFAADIAVQTANGAKSVQCAVPEFVKKRADTRQPDHSATQAEIRRTLAQLYDDDNLRGYVCEDAWNYKPSSPPQQADSPPVTSPFPAFMADIVKVLLIAVAICSVGWLLYRYRDQFAVLARLRPPGRATEIAGLDIRPESLPEDVAAEVAALWAAGRRRAALALLYRATISRLVNEDHLPLSQGTTEGDCMRLVTQACRRQQFGDARMQAAASITDLWTRAAYGNHWPDSAAISAECAAWRSEFGASRANGMARS
jgi:hypothetical protein